MSRAVQRVALGMIGACMVMLFVPVTAACILLWDVATVGRSRWVVAGCALSMLCPLILWLAAVGRRRWRIRFLIAGGVCALGALSVWGVCVAQTPDGRALPGAGVSSVYLGEARYARCSLANLVPEVDQLMMGARLIHRLDPLIDEAQAERLRGLFGSVYGAMRTSEAFRTLGSALHDNYGEWLTGRIRSGHFYEYIPPMAAAGDGETIPVIVFLHGSLGNFKGYLWVWHRFAKRHDVAIVAPSFGAGNWDRPGGVAAVEAIMGYIKNHPRLDERRVYLAGLSNGGKGVARVATRHPDAFSGLIMMSAVMEADILTQQAFVEGWIGRRMLVLHGTEDRRIPLAFVDQATAMLEDVGIRVDSVFYENEDHFLFFSDPDHVLQDIAEWMALDALDESD